MIQQIKQNALNNQRDRQRLSSLRPKSQCSLNKGVDYSAKQIYPTFRLAAYKGGNEYFAIRRKVHVTLKTMSLKIAPQKRLMELNTINILIARYPEAMG